MALTPESIEAVAQRVAELLAPTVDRSELIDAAEVARRLGVDRGWVYANAERLGAHRIGEGPRGRLRFDPERIVEATAPRPFTAPPVPPRRQPRPRPEPSTVPLLPIGPKR